MTPARRAWAATVVLTVAAPLVCVPSAFDRFTLPKLVVASVGCFVAFTVPSSTTIPPKLRWALAAVLAAFVIAALASVAASSALWGRWPRYDGLPLLALAMLCLAAGARLAGVGGLERLPTCAAIGSIVLCCFSVLDTIRAPLLATAATRGGSITGNATDQGLLALVYAIMCTALIWHPRHAERALGVAGVVTGLLTVCLAESRAVWLAALLALAVIAIQRFKPKTRYIVGAVSIAVACVVLVTPLRGRLLDAHTWQGRWILWGETLRLWTSHPLTGVGPSQFGDQITQVHTQSWVHKVGMQSPPDAPHNVLLGTLSSGGVLLASACVWLAYLTWQSARRHISGSGGAVVLSLAAVGLVWMTYFPTSGPLCMAAFLGGLLIGRRGRRVPRYNGAAIALAASLGALYVSSSIADFRLQRGIDEAARGDISAAHSSFERAQSYRPWDRDIALIAAKSLAGAAADNPSAARISVQYASNVIHGDPQSAEAFIARSYSELMDSRPAAALADATHAIRLSPMDARPHIYLAYAYLNTARPAQALAEVQAGLELDPNNGDGLKLFAALHRL